VLLLLLGGCSKSPEPSRIPPPVTIVLISIDTCRADALGCYGRKLADGSSPTPVIDALAKDGVAFQRAYTPVPLTLPAHTTMFSGLYPDRHGVRENDSFKVPKREKRKFTLLAEDLKAAGFQTAAFVSAQPMERRFGLAGGFDVYDEPDRKTARGGGQRFRERTARETAAKVVAHVRAGLAPRSFLFAHFFDPHAPYEPETRHPGLPPGIWGDYLGEVMAVDRAIGEILAALPNGGRDAWVIVTADHGEGLGEHGEASHGLLLYDTTLRVPLVIRAPAGTTQPPDAADGARLVDLAPTVRGIAGLPVAGTDGRSLLTHPEAAFFDRAETLYGWYQFRYARLRAARRAMTKLIEGGGAVEYYSFSGRPDEPPIDETSDAASNPAAAKSLAELRQLLRDALASNAPAEAQSTFDVPDVAGPYFGGRPPGTALEPTDDENAKLPRAQDRWNVINDLEEARAALRRGEASRAVLLLKAHEKELATNPALLFWTARAHHELGKGSGASKEARLAELDEAAKLYREVKSRFGDPRGLDSELLVLRARHAITGDAADLGRIVTLANGEIAASGGTALTFALRGVAKRDQGDAAGALADLTEAAKRDPDDPRIAADLADLRKKQ
jgi:arylsulfatase A-like enzyme